MKQIIITIAIALCSAMSAMAQNDSLAQAYSRIKSLEDKLEQQNSQINKLSSDVNEVLKQNLALKKNLNLQPTIATAKSGDLEYRIVELTGDPVKNIVTGIMMVENTGLKEVLKAYPYPVVIDGNGSKFDTSNIYKAHFKDNPNSLAIGLTSYPIKTPMQIIFTLEGISPETKYFKYFGVRHNVGEEAVFQNLPIKWAEQ